MNGLLFLMFLLSIGYNNNLLLIFTLFLFTFNLLWMIQTHFHLHRLKLAHVSVSPGHAKEPLKLGIQWSRTPQGPWEWRIRLESEITAFECHTLNNDEAKTEGDVVLPERGVYHWNYLRVSSIRPFGLYKVWIYYPLDFKTIVYPPLLSSADIPLSGQGLEGELLQDRKGQDEFRGLAQYGHDESRKISWKHYARTGDLLVKEGEEKLSPVLEIHLKTPQEPKLKEHYLSYVATQMVECYRREIPFSLDGIPAGTHAHHLQECLKVLALC